MSADESRRTSGIAEQRALVGQDNGRLTLFDTLKGERVSLFEGHTDSILVLDVDWESNHALSGGSDGAVYLWDLSRESGCNLAEELETSSCVRALAVDWSNSGKSESFSTQPPETGDFEGSLSRKNTLNSLKGLGTPLARESRMLGRQRSQTFVPPRSSVGAGIERQPSMMCGRSSTQMSFGASTASWSGDLRPGRIYRSKSSPISNANFRKLMEWRMRALTGSDDGLLRLWDLNAKYLEKTFNFKLRLISALAVDWKRMRALVGHGDSSLDLIDLEASTNLRSLQGHSCLIGAMCVSWPKGVALVGSGDGTLALWDVRRGSQVRALQGHSGSITVARAKWSSMRALTGSTDFTLRLWQMKQGCCLQTFAHHECPIRSVSVDWCTGLVVSAGEDGRLLLWNITDDTKRPEELKLDSGDGKLVCAGVIALQAQLLSEDKPELPEVLAPE